MKFVRPRTAVMVSAAAFVAVSSSVGAWALTSADEPAANGSHTAARNGSTSADAGTRAEAPTPNQGTVTSAAAHKNVLKAGQALKPGKQLRSTNGSYRLIQQTDGNLVLYKGRTPLWSSVTGRHPGAYSTMQTDGNLVVYGKNRKPLWSSNTAGNPGAWLAVQDDGNLVIYGKNKKALWGRNLYVTLLPPNTLLKAGQGIRSQNGRYYLVQQTDGNLVLYKGAWNGPKTALWSTVTGGHPGAFTVMQGDGNLVVYGKDKKPLWHTGTAPHKGAYLGVQNDGNLVVYSATKKVLWWRDMYNVQVPSGYLLKPGQAVLSHNRRYFLIQQTDGNLVLYKGAWNGPKTALWSTVTGGHPGAFTAMQGDGNLVVYGKDKKPLWHTGTAPHKGAYLMMQDDGNLVVYSTSKKPLWSSKTAGK